MSSLPQLRNYGILWLLGSTNLKSILFSGCSPGVFHGETVWLLSCLLHPYVEHQETVSHGVYMYCFVVKYDTFLPLLLYLKRPENHPILQKSHSSWLKRLHTSLGLVDFCQLLQLSGQTGWRRFAACDYSQPCAFIGSLYVHSLMCGSQLLRQEHLLTSSKFKQVYELTRRSASLPPRGLSSHTHTHLTMESLWAWFCQYQATNDLVSGCYIKMECVFSKLVGDAASVSQDWGSLNNVEKTHFNTLTYTHTGPLLQF